jgi:hypothetical protein
MSLPIAMNASEEIDSLLHAISARATENIAWYQRKKRTQRRWYYASSALILISSALIPALSSIPGENPRIATAVCGVVVVIATGLSTLFRWQLNWLNYVAAQDKLESLFLRWKLDVNRLHSLPDDIDRLLAFRKLADQVLLDLQAARTFETATTLPSAKPATEPGPPNAR